MFKFINNIFDSTKIYFLSRGIAWFDFDAVVRALNYLCSRSCASGRDLWDAGVLDGVRFATSPAEPGYILKLLWYLGFLDLHVEDHRFLYSINRRGRRFIEAYRRDNNVARRLFLEAVIEWPPLIKMLQYIHANEPIGWRDIVSDLGGDMEFWSGVMHELGFDVEAGIKKPYNEFVTPVCLIPIGREFELIEGDRDSLRLTKLGKIILRERGCRKFEIVKNTPDIPLFYGLLCWFLSESKRLWIAFPRVDPMILLKPLNVLKRINMSNLEEIIVYYSELVCSESKGRIRLAFETVNIEIHLEKTYQPVNAKIITNGKSMFWSAIDLARDSLQEYHVGMLIRESIAFEHIVNFFSSG